MADEAKAAKLKKALSSFVGGSNAEAEMVSSAFYTPVV